MDGIDHFLIQPTGLSIVQATGFDSHSDGCPSQCDNHIHIHIHIGTFGDGHTFGNRYPADANRGSSHSNARSQPDPDRVGF
jgi:hypothetical protein